jgi:hypothetical protein
MCNPKKIKMEEEDDGEGWRCRRRKSENLMNRYKMKCEHIYKKIHTMTIPLSNP